MPEIKDMYDNIYEQVDADNKQKLSSLQEKIQSHLSSPLDIIGNSIVGEKTADKPKVGSNQLISSLFAKRLSKDIIVDALTPDTQGDKNQKVGRWEKIKDKLTDAVTDSVLKQKNSYDSALTAMREPIIQKFSAELDELKKLVAVPTGNGSTELPVENNHDHGHEEEDYDNVEGGDKYGDAKEFSFNIPLGLPIAGMTKKSISSHMGHRHSPKAGASSDHKGIDIKTPIGTDLYAPGDGKVVSVAEQAKGAGKYIEIDHGDYITRYFHLDVQGVKVGDIVKKGQVIGKTGNSGNSTGPHLHYEIRSKKDIVYADKKGNGKFKVLDPEKYIDFDGDGKIAAA